MQEAGVLASQVRCVVLSCGCTRREFKMNRSFDGCIYFPSCSVFIFLDRGEPMAEKPQTFANHRRTDSPFHLFLVPVAIISVIAAIVQLIRFPGLGNAWLLVIAVAAIVAVFR